jgi:hypothetical protein
MKISLFYLIISINLYASEYIINDPFFTLKYKSELKTDYNIYYSQLINNSKSQLDELSILHNKIYTNQRYKEEMYSKTMDIVSSYPNNKLIVLIALDTAIGLYGIGNKEYLEKYIKPIANIAYKMKLCNGFIYVGDYENKLYHNTSKTLQIYKDGLKICTKEKNLSAYWALNARYDKLEYLSGDK